MIRLVVTDLDSNNGNQTPDSNHGNQSPESVAEHICGANLFPHRDGSCYRIENTYILENKSYQDL